MTVSKAVVAEIRRLYFAEHWKRGTIAAQLGVHFDVVVRVLGSFGPKAGSPRPDARVLEPYIPFVDETLSRYPRLVATRIQDMLVERGYEGSVRTLRRYVREARPAPRNEVFLRVETLPGEQAQVDWAHVGSLPVAGGHRALWAFVMVLAYSRAMWAELVVDLGVDSLCRSLVRAVAFFGGCTRQWLFDYVARHVIVILCPTRLRGRAACQDATPWDPRFCRVMGPGRRIKTTDREGAAYRPRRRSIFRRGVRAPRVPTGASGEWQLSSGEGWPQATRDEQPSRPRLNVRSDVGRRGSYAIGGPADAPRRQRRRARGCGRVLLAGASGGGSLASRVGLSLGLYDSPSMTKS